MMLLRAFSSGAVALSGVEAVSNGVPAFKKPESKNAATTIVMDGRHPRHLLPRCVRAGVAPASPFRGENDGTGLALMAEHVYDGKGVMFWIMT
jgi:hypothetical protein